MPAQLYELGTTTPTDELLKFSQKVSTHLTKIHPERVALNFAIYQMFDSYSVLACFHLNGPLLVEFDKMRHQLHKHTRYLRVSDNKLLEKVASLGLLSTIDQQKVLKMYTEMRDLYEERGLYPEIEEAEKKATEAGHSGVIVS